MTTTEITYQLKILDQRIRDINSWIEFHYSTYAVRPTSSIDHQAFELGQRLDMYYHFRKQKDMLIAEYDKEVR